MDLTDILTISEEDLRAQCAKWNLQLKAVQKEQIKLKHERERLRRACMTLFSSVKTSTEHNGVKLSIYQDKKRNSS